MTHSRPSVAMPVILAAFIGILALPFVFRPADDPASTPAALRGDAADERVLTIVSPHWEGIRREYGRAFSQWSLAHLGHPTRLDWLDTGGTAEGVRFVLSEFDRSPDGIGVDLFFGGGIDPYIDFAARGLLSPAAIPANVLAAIPASFSGVEVYDASNRWFGAALAGFGILYNRDVCRRVGLPVPTTWEDLANPVYFSWVGSGDPRFSGSVHMVYEIILQACGWEAGWSILTRMCGNTRAFARGGGAVPRDAATGEIACGMAIDTYAWRAVAEAGADRLGFVLPEGLTIVNPDAVAILKGAPEPALAAQFIAFLLSRSGQNLWCLRHGTPEGPVDFDLYRLPVLPGLAASHQPDTVCVPYDPYQWEGGFRYSSEKGSARWTILNDLIGAMFIDAHRELAAAWQRACLLPADHPDYAALIAPPIPETRLLELAATAWKEPEQRARIRAAWASAAVARYGQIAGGNPQ